MYILHLVFYIPNSVKVAAGELNDMASKKVVNS